MLDEPQRCAAVSRSLGEALLGTASRVRNWLLVEQDGSWGRNALTESAIEPGVAQELKVRAARHSIRVVLIRRPRGGRDNGGHRCFLAHTGIERRWLRSVTVDRVADLLDLDLETVRAGEPPAAGSASVDALYLVCTNGEHDRCCELYGRPLVDRLFAARPEQTWESSHIGGDRFAGNLVCLPYGSYFGHVEPEEVEGVVEAHERGSIVLERYRGRSCYEPVVQAADVAIRMRAGLRGLDDLTPEARSDHGGGLSTVVFRGPGGERHEVCIQVTRADKRRLTCTASHPGAPREFRVARAPLEP